MEVLRGTEHKSPGSAGYDDKTRLMHCIPRMEQYLLFAVSFRHVKTDSVGGGLDPLLGSQIEKGIVSFEKTLFEMKIVNN